MGFDNEVLALPEVIELLKPFNLKKGKKGKTGSGKKRFSVNKATDALKDGALTHAKLAEKLGLDEETVKTNVAAKPDVFFVHGDTVKLKK